MVRAGLKWTLIYVLEALALLIALLIFAGGAVMWRLSSGPVELDLFRSNAQAALARAFDGDLVSMGRFQARYDAETSLLVFSAYDVAVADPQGRVVARAPVLEAGLALDALLTGRIAPVEGRVIGGSISMVRRADGAVGVGLGGVERVAERARLPDPDARPLEDLAALLVDPDRSAGPLGRLSRVEIDRAAIRIHDEVTGLSWLIDGARVELLRDDEEIVAAMAGRLASSAGYAPFDLRLESAASLDRFLLNIEAENLNPRALAPVRGELAALGGLDAAIEFELMVDATREVGLNAAQLDLTMGEGVFTLAGDASGFDGARLAARFDPEAGEVVIEDGRVEGDRLQTEISGRAYGFSAYAGALPTQWNFELFSPGGRLDLDGVFEAPPEWSALEASGRMDAARRRIGFDELNLDVGAAGIRLDGEIGLAEVEGAGWFPEFDLDGQVLGELGPRDVLDYWPVDFADGGRDWVEDGIIDVRATNARIRLDITAEAIANKDMPNDQLEISFDFEDAQVRYISTMTPLLEGRGRAVLRGNAFEAVVESGRINDLELTAGLVDLPRLNPKGATARFWGRGNGRVEGILRLIDEEPLGFPTEYGVDPGSIGGEGEIEFEFFRPMYRDVPIEDVEFTIGGVFYDVSAPIGVGDSVLSEAVVTLNADETRLHAEGEGMIAGAPVRIAWTEDLTAEDGDPSTSFDIDASVDARLLDSFGIPVRRYLDGDVDLDVSTRGEGFDFVSVDLRADFASAALEAPGGVWTKPLGAPGEARFTLRLNAERGFNVVRVLAFADGVDLAGRVRIDREGRLVDARADRLQVEGLIDMSGDITRPQGDRLSISARGAYLDAREIIARMSGLEPAPEPAEPAGTDPAGDDPGRAAEGGGPALDMRLDLDRLLAADDAMFENIQLRWSSDARGVSAFSLEGDDRDGRIQASFGAEREGEARLFQLDAPSAARLLALVGWSEYADGGSLRLIGSAPPLGQSGPLNARLEVDDVTVVRAPVVARVLAAGSLEGLVALLDGSGIPFERIDGEILWEAGLLTLGDFRASGSSLGVTGAGTIDFAAQETAFDGTIAPAYAVNSMFGDVPIIGDLLVSRPGEGVVGVTFSVEGPFEAVRVAANPLSVLAPGVLRRIFEGTAAQRAAEMRERRDVDPLEDPVEIEDGPGRLDEDEPGFSLLPGLLPEEAPQDAPGDEGDSEDPPADAAAADGPEIPEP